MLGGIKFNSEKIKIVYKILGPLCNLLLVFTTYGKDTPKNKTFIRTAAEQKRISFHFSFIF